MVTFTDDTVILSVTSSNEKATDKLQTAVKQILSWTKKWRVKLNESKSSHINFTIEHFEHILTTLNN